MLWPIIISRSRALWVAGSVLEHVTQQFLHGGVSDGPVEEQQLYPLRVDEAQRGEEEEQLPQPASTKTSFNPCLFLKIYMKITVWFSLGPPGSRRLWEEVGWLRCAAYLAGWPG